MSIRIFHYSWKPIKKIVQKRYYSLDSVPWDEMSKDVRNIKPPGKPIGFWVSAGTSWHRWCKENDFWKERIKYKYRIHLQKDHGVLMIHDLDSFDDLCFEYGHDPYKIYESISERTKQLIGKCKDGQGKFFQQWQERSYYPDLRWDLLKKRYKGLLICPYFYERRLMTSHSQWYYGWDCASGCIWDVSAIKSFELEKQYKVKRARDKNDKLTPKEMFSNLLQQSSGLVAYEKTEGANQASIIPDPGPYQWRGSIRGRCAESVGSTGQEQENVTI